MTNGTILNHMCGLMETLAETQHTMTISGRAIGIRWVGDAWECVDLDSMDTIMLRYSEDDQVVFDPLWCNEEVLITHHELRETYHWIDDNTGELRENLWKVIIGDIQDAVWCIKNRHGLIRRKWRYDKKGW